MNKDGLRNRYDHLLRRQKEGEKLNFKERNIINIHSKKIKQHERTKNNLS